MACASCSATEGNSDESSEPPKTQGRPAFRAPPSFFLLTRNAFSTQPPVSRTNRTAFHSVTSPVSFAEVPDPFSEKGVGIFRRRTWREKAYCSTHHHCHPPISTSGLHTPGHHAWIQTAGAMAILSGNLSVSSAALVVLVGCSRQAHLPRGQRRGMSLAFRGLRDRNCRAVQRPFGEGIQEQGRVRPCDLAVFVLFLSCLLTQGVATAQVKPIRRILILNEVNPSYPAIPIVFQGIQTALSNSPYHLEFYSEYFDITLFPEPAVQQEFLDFYIRKYKNHVSVRGEPS